MSHRYLEVTFRGGKPLAAYLYLPRRPNDKSYRTPRATPGLIIDFNRGGAPIGIEITAPAKLSAAALNRAGLGRNDRVAIVLPNGPEMATCFLACASSVTSAPLNPAYRADDPIVCTAVGAGRVQDDAAIMRRLSGTV